MHGHVDSIAPASGQEFALLPPDNATGNFTKVVQRIPVKIALDGGNDASIALRPGMSVIPTIETRSQGTSSEVPAARSQGIGLAGGHLAATASKQRIAFREDHAMSHRSPSASISAASELSRRI